MSGKEHETISPFGEHQWQGVVIRAKDLRIVEEVRGGTVEEGLEKIGGTYRFRQDDLAAVDPVPLNEENVETLLTAALGKVFAADPMLVLSRERALFQTPDIVGVTATGRIVVVELKNRPAKGAEIVAQTTEYLVQCARRNLTALERWFQGFYRQIPVFQSLYHAGLLKEVSAEGGTKKLVLGRHPELKKLSEAGGLTYFAQLANAVEEYARKELGMDVTASREPVMDQLTGGADPAAGLLAAACARFGYDSPAAQDAFREAVNRDWRLVFFAPTFWFDNEVKNGGKPSPISRTTVRMLQRGVDMSFLEYRVARSISADGLPQAWFLAWRQSPAWEEMVGIVTRNAGNIMRKIEARKPGSTFDMFRRRILQAGAAILKDPAYAWHVAFPDGPCMRCFTVEYPEFVGKGNYVDGCVRFRADQADAPALLPDKALLNELARVGQEAVQTLSPGVRVSAGTKGTRRDPAVTWKWTSCEPLPDPAEAGELAGRIVGAVLTAYRQRKNC